MNRTIKKTETDFDVIDPKTGKPQGEKQTVQEFVDEMIQNPEAIVWKDEEGFHVKKAQRVAIIGNPGIGSTAARIAGAPNLIDVIIQDVTGPGSKAPANIWQDGDELTIQESKGELKELEEEFEDWSKLSKAQTAINEMQDDEPEPSSAHKYCVNTGSLE